MKFGRNVLFAGILFFFLWYHDGKCTTSSPMGPPHFLPTLDTFTHGTREWSMQLGVYTVLRTIWILGAPPLLTLLMQMVPLCRWVVVGDNDDILFGVLLQSWWMRRFSESPHRWFNSNHVRSSTPSHVSRENFFFFAPPRVQICSRMRLEYPFILNLIVKGLKIEGPLFSYPVHLVWNMVPSSKAIVDN